MLSERNVLVTGAASGIGAALCRRIVAAGGSVAALDIDEPGLARLGAELGDRAFLRRCNVTRYDECRDAVAQARQALGGIDLVIANAGIAARSGFAESDVEVFRRVMEVNYFGALHVVKAALLDLLARRGQVVVVSSVAGLVPLYGRSAYAASKHALHGLFETARVELAASGVDVTIVCPSFTRSGLDDRALGADGRPHPRRRTSVGRTAEPDQVAAAILAAAARGRRLSVMSPVGKLALWLSRLAPRAYDRLMVRNLRAELEAEP